MLTKHNHCEEVFLIQGHTKIGITIHCREVAVLKRKKHKREFKYCQPGQIGVTFMEKDWAYVEVAILRGFSVCVNTKKD